MMTRWIYCINKEYLHIENLQFMVVFPIFLLVCAIVLEYKSLDVWWISHLSTLVGNYSLELLF
jgi:hypothetical protein